jgi:hypothetical protein
MNRLNGPRIAVAAAVCFLSPVVAHATDVFTDYTMAFTQTGGSPAPTSGQFIYDDTVNTFTSFTVNWNGEVLNFMAAANAGPLTAGTCNAGPGTGAEQTLDMLTGVDPTGCAQNKTYQFATGDYDFLGNPTVGANAENISISDPSGTPGVGSIGTYSVTATTPEPSTLAMLALGLATLGGLAGGAALRKRLHPRSEG